MSDKPIKHPDFYAEPANYQHLAQEDEIDLFELFSVLFQSKYLIIAISFIFAIIGFGTASFLPHKWTSTAAVVKPGLEEYQPLKNALTDLYVLNLEPKVTESSLYDRFIENYNSRVLREEYLINTDYFKALLAKSDNHSEQEERKLIEQIVNKKISSSLPKKDDELKETTLSFSAGNASDAYNLLNGYIKFVSSVVREQVKEELNDMVHQKLAYSQKMYELDLSRIANMRSVGIERLKYAISIAESAGVKKPTSSGGAMIKDDPDYSIALGSDALQRKLQITKEVTDPTKIDADLLNRQLYIKSLEKVNVDKVDFKPFRYMQEPYEPTSKDSPKRLLILIGAGFIGFILSVMFVLLRHMVRSRQKQAV
ncbi:Ferric enterobactin transport protein [Xenorhabdus nematophila ATCC 19061]|uniref:Ferric enterobactin transport protein n=1 Tax=Xenorhabdus nematophila (strain ATCC 19061 / DSM 3370 / CCUG 14189 / LMG 1036 / NCIMB 9965 / AN6) TaxID=406817 RepID=D3VL58_XENNA|nr:LPS O-antigen length regulator Wzz(fepE) [Xenorhabdus nematophila]CBJ89017.1 Ferric enterobactin transport protein [Xenorhabdus nematophila ATCC 19061]CEK21926.1 Ferric enterobactin transport protein [Xenorhabdus nematophila AN6/1]